MLIGKTNASSCKKEQTQAFYPAMIKHEKSLTQNNSLLHHILAYFFVFLHHLLVLTLESPAKSAHPCERGSRLAKNADSVLGNLDII